MIIKTISTVDGVNVVDFGNTVNKYYWFKNLGDSTIYVANKEDFKAGDDGVSELTAKGAITNIEASDGKVYILGAGKVEIHNTDSKLPPFKSAPVAGSGGGDTQYGENLFNLENFKTTLSSLSEPAPNGNIKWLDNGFTLNATSEDCYTYWQYGSAPAITVKSNTLYELSFDVNGASGTNYMFFESPPSINKMISFSNHNSKFVFRTISGTSKLTLRFGVLAAGTSCTFTNIKLRQIL